MSIEVCVVFGISSNFVRQINSVEIIKCCDMIGHVYYMSLLIG